PPGRRGTRDARRARSCTRPTRNEHTSKKPLRFKQPTNTPSNPSLRAPATQSILQLARNMDCFVACAPRNDGAPVFRVIASASEAVHCRHKKGGLLRRVAPRNDSPVVAGKHHPCH